jgi:phosphohistidine phosphatase SixA
MTGLYSTTSFVLRGRRQPVGVVGKIDVLLEKMTVSGSEIRFCAMRHGYHNRSSRMPDEQIPLEPRGKEQALAARARLLAELGPDASMQVYSSPYRRAVQTAALVGDVPEDDVEKLLGILFGEEDTDLLLEWLVNQRPIGMLVLVGHEPMLLGLMRRAGSNFSTRNCVPHLLVYDPRTGTLKLEASL